MRPPPCGPLPRLRMRAPSPAAEADSRPPQPPDDPIRTDGGGELAPRCPAFPAGSHPPSSPPAIPGDPQRGTKPRHGAVRGRAAAAPVRGGMALLLPPPRRRAVGRFPALISRARARPPPFAPRDPARAWTLPGPSPTPSTSRRKPPHPPSSPRLPPRRMGSRKPSCLLETVWEDKRKYDEAERRHYEREAAQAAAEASPPPASPNGLSREESGDDGGQDSRRAPVGDRKQKKRKRSPRHKSPGLDFALVGLSADHVWFDKPLFDRAERAYRAMLADVLAGEGPEAGAAEPPPDSGPRPEGQASAPAGTPCAHGNRTACHHVVRGVWLNKFYFDRAERAFVERSQVLAPPRPLDLPALPLPEAHPASGWGTPDEGYITAVPTPAAAGLPPVGEDPPAGGSPSALGWPGPSSPPANGKPRLAGLRALMAEVWLAKPRFDNAERRFYEAMFDGHPPGKVRLQEREGPRDAARRGRKERRNRNATGKRPGPKRAELCGPEEAGSPPPPCRSPREDSEPRWPGEPPLGGPGSRHRAVRTLRTARPARARAAPPSASAPGALLDARDPHSVSAIEPK
uniref:Uncharacterized protein n=1 Tax=Ornithorhynchus anatinus TaxID=9258 RepID=A0A6I8P920_ORNAN